MKAIRSGDLFLCGFFLEERVDNRKDFFNRHASTWDRDLQYGGKTGELLEVVKWFELSEGDSVLDVGTGTGILLPFIKEAIGLKGMLIAMDFSLKMLEQAKLRQYVDEKILINASVGAIPFRSNQFDRLTCFAAFPHFPDKARALFEMVRVLRNGGKLFIAHLHSVEEINQLHRQVGGPVAHDLLPHRERIRTLMADSGLGEISIINQTGKFLAQGQKR
jgi:ubiquinone/menaquinone biosynthesis C-methylase UbiE